VGRWTLVHRFGVLGTPVSQAEAVARQARQLLARHGVVTRQSLDDEIGAWDWGRLTRQLQRLELRGEIRRGYFVEGLPGLQYALPEAVERLRAARDGIGEPDDLILMNACDPANLYGLAQEGGPVDALGEPMTFARVPSTWLVQHRGFPVLVASDTGAHITTLQGVDPSLLGRAVGMLLDHWDGFERRITVESWDGMPVLDSPGASILEAHGFRRSYPTMIWDRGVR
jgi:ATP-dependent Lhr-like helicase